MSKTVLWIQWGGLLLMGVSAFGINYHYKAYPSAVVQQVARADVRTASQPDVTYRVMGAPEVPAREVGIPLVAWLNGQQSLRPLWEKRRWYPYLLLPLWILAMVLVRGKGRPAESRRRRLVGEGMWLLALCVGGFEFAYLFTEYAPFMPGFLGQVEIFLTWCFVLGMLFYRRKADRKVGAVEATVASQGLLAFAHAMTLPSTMARGWVGSTDLGTVIRTVFINFPPLFWIGCAGTLMIALPIYLRRTPAVDTDNASA